jgi:cysteine desulfurase/selenocysteine lyase
MARNSEEKLREARATAAKFINALSDEIVFVRNTTEGINMLSLGLKTTKGDNIVVSALEHHSNFLPWMRKCQNTGGNLRIVFPKNEEGLITADDFAQQIDKNTRIVALTHVSNVLGTILPVKEIVKIAHENDAVVVLDAAQSAPHMPVDVKKLNVDFLTFSGHKICGPTGAGLLYIKKDMAERMEPVRLGGGIVAYVDATRYELLDPPARFEAGTLPYCEVMAMADAFEYVRRIGFENILSHDRKLITIAHEILHNVRGLKIYGPSIKNKTSIFAFNIMGLDPTEVAMILDTSNKVEVRSGHLCAQICTRKILGEAEGVVRASTYFYNKEEEIVTFAESVKKIVDTMVT